MDKDQVAIARIIRASEIAQAAAFRTRSGAVRAEVMRRLQKAGALPGEEWCTDEKRRNDFGRM